MAPLSVALWPPSVAALLAFSPISRANPVVHHHTTLPAARRFLALSVAAARPLAKMNACIAEATYLRAQVHVTAYVAPAVADAPQRYIRHAHVRTCTCQTASVRGAGARSFQRLSRAPVKI